MKLLGSNESKVTRDKNVEDVPHLEITEAVLFHSNIVNNDYQSYIHLFQISHLVVYYKFLQKITSF